MRNARLLLVLSFVSAACGTGTGGMVTVTPQSCPPASTPVSPGDQDQDGLDDAMELAWAQQYMPALSISARDSCPTAGVVVRVTPTATSGRIHIIYDVLYNQDCGVGGHVGDDEV